MMDIDKHLGCSDSESDEDVRRGDREIGLMLFRRLFR